MNFKVVFCVLSISVAAFGEYLRKLLIDFVGA
jgi:hypothetical protein